MLLKLLFTFVVGCPLFSLAQQYHKKSILLEKMVLKDSVYQLPLQHVEHNSSSIFVLDENLLKDNQDNITSAPLSASRDPYKAVAAFQFGAMRMQSKGLGNAYATITVNGLPMMDPSNGSGQWSSWTGLNEVFKTNEVSSVFQQNSYAANTLGESANIDIRATKQKAGSSFGYGFSNRLYTHRISFTHHTGVSLKGWAFSMSATARNSTQSAIPGVANKGYAYYFSIDKNFLSNDFFSLSFFGANMQTDRQSSILKESVKLLNTEHYNPSWGFQNGRVRNANQASTHLPVLLMTHEHRLSNQTFMQTSISFSKGMRFNTGLDWYHTPDPRPDYYRYLPSYQQDPVLKEQETFAIQNNTNLQQLNWHRFYEINNSNIEKIDQVDGILGNAVIGKRARYILENRNNAIQRFQFATCFQTVIGGSIFFSTGISYHEQNSRYYKTVNDLLGADFYVNWNQFAESATPNDPQGIQFDVNKPNRILGMGDAFGYDYTIKNRRTAIWLQASQQINRFGWSIASEFSYASFWRSGAISNGLFPTSSIGESQANIFLNKGFKLSLNYALDGRNRVYLSAAVKTRPPSPDNVFLSPRTRDTQQDLIESENGFIAEMGYLLQSQKIKCHLSTYFLSIQQGMDVLGFYHDGYNSFMNYGINGIGQLHYGLEFGIDAQIFPNMNLQAATAIGNHVFNSRQFAVVTTDNTAAIMDQLFIYAKNYPIGGAPQQAFSFGFNYRFNYRWFFTLSTNFFDRQFLSWNPIRRTAEALYPIIPASDLGKKLLQPERLPAKYLVNAFISRRIPLNKSGSQLFDISLSITNLLNKQDLTLSGYEQLRFDFDNKDPNKFPPKYFYLQGLNFLCSINYRF